MKILLLLSGGLDSTTLLFDLLDQGHAVSCLSIFYGQKHAKELDSAKKVAELAGVDWSLFKIDPVLFSESNTVSSLVSSGPRLPQGHYHEESMRSTVVPYRNQLLISIASCRAVSISADAVAIGSHAGDHFIYPDCRPEFISAMRDAMALGDSSSVSLLSPYSNMNKREIVARASALGVPSKETWTCYEGSIVPCGECGACHERAEAENANQ